jgi:hypothetical protein
MYCSTHTRADTRHGWKCLDRRTSLLTRHVLGVVANLLTVWQQGGMSTQGVTQELCRWYVLPFAGC